MVILLSIIPVYFANRLTRDEGADGATGAAATAAEVTAAP